jgi:hypothetical protein
MRRLMSAERDRLRAMEVAGETPRTGAWYLWGPYLAERAWGTVREDYSADGNAWAAFPFDQARSRAYRWNEDGMAGICDIRGRLNLALAIWNGVDPFLKERMFGLSGPQGNHGEDAKDHWWYVDALPTHAWLRWRYHYPQTAFPYELLVSENARRGRDDPEFELLDTGVFDDGRYWVVEVDYAKADPTDIRMRVRARNRGPDRATIHVLPTMWFRNTWSWGRSDFRPRLHRDGDRLVAEHAALGRYLLEPASGPDGTRPRLLFCDNETNSRRLWGTSDGPPFPRDGINDHVVDGAPTVNPEGEGTKAAAWYRLEVGPGETAEVSLRLAAHRDEDSPGNVASSKAVFAARLAEADEFYAELTPADASDEEANVMRQAFAGLIWSKQHYRYTVAEWLEGDPASPRPPSARLSGRNREWRHLDASDVLSVPDAWEYPWFAAWDLAFHCVALAHIDPAFAKDQMLVLGREWYLHPNGQLPAYEWNFSDVNPPVHAWAAFRVFRLDGRRDHEFLERVFHKLLLNFTWWVNRKDPEGRNIFGGGFLGLDNISPLDRSNLPPGWRLEQADGTGWMAWYCLSMLVIAGELALHDDVYQDLAVKFFEHFAYVSGALNGLDLWNEDECFFYDRAVLPSGQTHELRYRSVAGLIPLLSLAFVPAEILERVPEFTERARWFLENRPEASGFFGRAVTSPELSGAFVSIVDPDRLIRIMREVFRSDTFLSDHGLRSLSREHLEHPFRLEADGVVASVGYEPAESRSGLYGGNSNWRGPIWFPLAYLMIETLDRAALAARDRLLEYPTGSGRTATVADIARDLSRRLVSLFLRGSDGRRPADGRFDIFTDDPDWRDLVTFYEYFDAETGAGLGASHQTGWTALVAHLIANRARRDAVGSTNLGPAAPR